MRTINLFTLFVFILILASCTQDLPENYGIYISSNKKLFLLNPQKTLIRGNLIESVSGLQKSSGSNFKSIDYIIIFEQNVIPENLKLSKLIFNNGSYIQNLFGSSFIKLNFYTSEKEIPLNIAPVEGEKDMYIITPSQQLDSGFYAIHYGCLTNQNTSDAFNKIAFDFVIGSINSNYLSYDDLIKKNLEEFNLNAKLLLEKINIYLNTKEYSQIRKILVRPDGNDFNDDEWELQIEGFENWMRQAGKIKSSIILNSEIEGNYGSFQIQTQYENLGIIKEEFRIMKRESLFYITNIISY